MAKFFQGMKCFSAIASFSLVTFPSNKCVCGGRNCFVLFFLSIMELKDSWEISVLPFGMQEFAATEGKRKEHREVWLRRHSQTCSWGDWWPCHSIATSALCLIWIFTFFGGMCSKPFIPLTLPAYGDFISTEAVREILLYDPQLVFSTFIRMVPVAFLAMKLKVERVWECFKDEKCPVALLTPNIS